MADTTTEKNNSKGIIDHLHAALNDEDIGNARDLLAQLHPSEIADVMEGLPGKARTTVWNLIDPEIEGEVLSELQDAVRAELLGNMHPYEVAKATRDLDADDVADIIQDLPEGLQDSVLLAMDAQYRQRLTSLLSYPEDTAGGLMNTDVVSVRADVSLDVVMRYLHLLGEIPQRTDSLMVVEQGPGIQRR